MDTSVALVTVSVVLPDTLVTGSVAVIVVDPAATDVAKPSEPPALLIVAFPVSDELHVTDVVMFWVELSEYVPVAVNCFVNPSAMLGFVGVTEIDTRFALVTVNAVFPAT